jgi:hypothetical protein
MAEATTLYQDLGFPALKKSGHDKKLVGSAPWVHIRDCRRCSQLPTEVRRVEGSFWSKVSSSSLVSS